MNDSPCRCCAERKLLCHSVCDKYQNWKNERDQVLRIRDAVHAGTPGINMNEIRKHWRRQKYGTYKGKTR